MSNKDSVAQFLKLLSANQVRTAYEKFVAPDFIHHNQYVKAGREDLLLAMEEAHRENPNTRIDIKHLYEDGDTVISHSHVTMQPGTLGVAVVHIFRFRDGKAVELWDLGQPILKDSPNAAGLF